MKENMEKQWGSWGATLPTTIYCCSYNISWGRAEGPKWHCTTTYLLAKPRQLTAWRRVLVARAQPRSEKLWQQQRQSENPIAVPGDHKSDAPYSDGITEARQTGGKAWRRGRLRGCHWPAFRQLLCDERPACSLTVSLSLLVWVGNSTRKAQDQLQFRTPPKGGQVKRTSEGRSEETFDFQSHVVSKRQWVLPLSGWLRLCRGPMLTSTTWAHTSCRKNNKRSLLAQTLVN